MFTQITSRVLKSTTLDLAETMGFSSVTDDLPSFDSRPDREVLDAARSHPDRVERERALWEFAYRRKESLLPLLMDTLKHEQDPAIRWNILWLAVKQCENEALSLLEVALSDPHPEVRDWAKVYLNEIVNADLASEYDTGVYVSTGAFDQTLPLQIAGFALVMLPGMGPMRVNLSPLWFEYILGRVLACTNLNTFMRDLTIEKCLEGYHPDGSNHYEIFPFTGISWPTSETSNQHRYESVSLRSLYRSGRVEDKSAEVLPKVPVFLMRSADTSSAGLIKVLPSDIRDRTLPVANPKDVAIDLSRVVDARGVRLLNGRIVKSVRGQFFGWAHASLAYFAKHGKILPGTVQLANPLHEGTADLVNTYLCGTFRGKIGDHNGDGLLDINLIPCHGTPAGELDYHADGTLAPDPFA